MEYITPKQVSFSGQSRVQIMFSNMRFSNWSIYDPSYFT